MDSILHLLNPVPADFGGAHDGIPAIFDRRDAWTTTDVRLQPTEDRTACPAPLF